MVAFGVASFAAAAGRVARSTLRPRRAPLNLTDTAASRVRELLQKRSKVILLYDSTSLSNIRKLLHGNAVIVLSGTAQLTLVTEAGH